jgi:hypothetical protein
MQYSCSPLNITPLNGVSRKENMENDPTKRKLVSKTQDIQVTTTRYSAITIL